MSAVDRAACHIRRLMENAFSDRTRDEYMKGVGLGVLRFNGREVPRETNACCGNCLWNN